jgi:biopolymer transport protein ExbD
VILLPQKDHEYEFQMVSFVDVIFVLLSFFVLGSQFKTLERDFALGYSQQPLAAGAKVEDFPESVQVELRRRGGGVAIAIGAARLKDDDFEAIRAKLSEINLPALPVLILADPDLSVDQVAKALDAALASPMKRVSVSGVRARGQPATAVALTK